MIPLYYKASFLYMGARAYLIGATTPTGTEKEVAVISYDTNKAKLFTSAHLAHRCEEILQSMTPDQFVCV